MPWWVWIWLGVMTLFMVGGVLDDAAEGIVRWKIGVDVLIHALTISFVLAYYLESLGRMLGPLAIPAVIISAIWNIIRTLEEMKSTAADPETALATNRGLWVFATLTWSALLLPAYVMGITVGVRNW